ncbi:helix-turn-helix domain-containing protein [Streptomyces sp. NPDC048484]|uniref:helix-turn-helix domain-containing protein n=1 Tax=Streptomyces sp. NPDC048484 TaxID=3155146 RepID=UPI00342D9E11
MNSSTSQCAGSGCPVAASVELELKCFTPEQAAAILGMTENWVVESVQAGSIPCTRIGKSPRLTAAQIRWIQAQGEARPHKYALARPGHPA